MSGQALVVRGGTLVTAYGMAEDVSLRIENGKVTRLMVESKGSTEVQWKERPHATLFDATDYYVLPGFVSFASFQAWERDTSKTYVERVDGYIRQGVTCLIHRIPFASWMGPEHVNYQLTAHYNSPIDYVIRIRLAAEHFFPAVVRQLARQGFRLLEVEVRSGSQMRQIDWESLYPILRHYKITCHLEIPRDSPLSRQQREEMIRDWTEGCRRGHVRTTLEYPGWAWDRDNGIPNQLIQLEDDQVNKALPCLAKDWYGYASAFCPIDHWRRPVSTNGLTPNALLCMLVRLASTNVAKVTGCYPAKGSLHPGADADLVFLQKTEWLTKFSLSTMLNISELCLPTYVMSKGKWLKGRETNSKHVGTGRNLSDVKPYNYAL